MEEDIGVLDFIDAHRSNNTSNTDNYECVLNKEGVYGPQLHTDKALDVVKKWKNSKKKDRLFLYMAYQLVHSPLEPNVLTDYRPVEHIFDKILDLNRGKFARLVYQLDLEVQ